MNKQDRILQLEIKAMRKYVGDIAWKFVIVMLSEQEQKEYFELIGDDLS